MCAKFVLLIAIYLQYETALGQRQWVSPTTTAQEMRIPSTWYRPYYQAAAEAYASYFQNARDIRNQLWQQAYATGAFGNRPNNPNNPMPNNPSGVPNNPMPNNPSGVPNNPMPNNPSGLPNNPSGRPNNPSMPNQNWG